MKAMCFAFDNFDLVVNTFDFPRMDRMIAVINDTVTMALKHVGKIGKHRQLD